MSKNAPGKSHREGQTVVQSMDMFPDEAAAVAWFESTRWPDGERHCGKCGSTRTRPVPNAKRMPYWCTDCRSYFSARTGTPIARSNVPMQKWAIAIYLCLTSLKPVSSMKLHRDLGVTQATAWFMLHRIREAWAHQDDDRFDGPGAADETWMGGPHKNMPMEVRAALDSHAKDGKTAIVGVGEYVDGIAHTDGIESFWSMLERAHKGTFHKLSPKHLQRYVSEFAGKHDIPNSGLLAQMRDTVARLVGRNLLCRDPIVDYGLSSGARS